MKRRQELPILPTKVPTSPNHREQRVAAKKAFRQKAREMQSEEAMRLLMSDDNPVFDREHIIMIDCHDIFRAEEVCFPGEDGFIITGAEMQLLLARVPDDKSRMTVGVKDGHIIGWGGAPSPEFNGRRVQILEEMMTFVSETL